MNIKDHPNINATKLMTQIHTAIMENLRDEGEKNKKELEFFLLGEARQIVIRVSRTLDEILEVK